MKYLLLSLVIITSTIMVGCSDTDYMGGLSFTQLNASLDKGYNNATSKEERMLYLNDIKFVTAYCKNNACGGTVSMGLMDKLATRVSIIKENH